MYIKNIQGDIYGITDVNGNLVVRYEYDAWGKVKEIIGNQTLVQLNPMRYRGYYYDEETGLYYLQSRYYDASVRRFINADAFEMIGNSDSYISYNLYAYCENNVVNLIDTYGYTGFMYSYKYYKDIRYDYTLKRYIGGKPYIFQFVLHKNFSDDAKEGKKGIVSVDFGLNNFKVLLKHNMTYSFAKHIVWLVRKLHSRFLYKRTVAGIEAELIIHYALYNDNLYVSHTKVCDMGSKWGFMYRGELIGTDSNAVIFESSFAKETAANIKKNFTNSQFVKKQLDRFCSKYSIF